MEHKVPTQVVLDEDVTPKDVLVCYGYHYKVPANVEFQKRFLCQHLKDYEFENKKNPHFYRKHAVKRAVHEWCGADGRFLTRWKAGGQYQEGFRNATHAQIIKFIRLFVDAFHKKRLVVYDNSSSCTRGSSTGSNGCCVAPMGMDADKAQKDITLKKKRAQGTKTRKTPGACQKQHERLSKTLKHPPITASKQARTRIRSKWTPKEGLLLRQKTEGMRSMSSDEIAKFFTKRSSNPCRSRYKYHMKSRKRKQSDKPWSEQDRRLVQASFLKSFPNNG